MTEGGHPRAKSENVVKILSHDIVADTGDGGLAGIMRRLGGRVIPCNAEREATKMKDGELDAVTFKPLKERANSLHAPCHCGTIQFDILPPPSDGLQRPQNVTRWLFANGTKYWGLHCACRSCRLTTGTSLAYQTYVMPENMVVKDKGSGMGESPFSYTSYDESTGNLRESEASLQSVYPDMKIYYRSEDRRRSFCGKCGASVFCERVESAAGGQRCGRPVEGGVRVFGERVD